MERDGQLMPNRKGMLLLSTKLDFVAGRVAGHRDGFGFLVRDDRGPDAFLSPREMQKVLHGDRVLVRITGTDHRGKPEGTIVEVTERKTNRLVGRLVSERGILLVIPEDQRIKHDILVSPKDVGNATPGKVVTVEIIEQPTRHSQPIGKVAEVLGELDDPGMEIEIAVRKFDVPHEFNLLTMNQAESIPNEVEYKDLKGRVDLRDVPFVTIDGEDARDFDDAVYCTPSNDTKGGWRLLVAIADVSHYVLPGTPIDQEATKRGTSGAIKAYQFYNAVIHSAARLTYNQVWDALTDSQSLTAKAMGHVYGDVENLYTLFKVLFESRQRRGAMEIDTVETQVMLDPDGKIDKIVPKRRNDAHRLIEECMLAANVCAADFLERSKHPSLYRQAIYTPHNSGHFGLAYPAYAHFTSPIRRYPDLMVHRSIKALLAGKRYVPLPLDEREFEDFDPRRRVDKAEEIARWDQSGNWFSSTERRADEASRDVMSWLKCFFMKERVGDTIQGHVSGVTSSGLIITLDALYVEGLVHVSELGTEYFQYSDSLHELRGERSGIRYRLTDPINVQVSRVDLDARRIEFRLVQGVKFESLMRDPGLAKPNGKQGNRPQRQQGRRTNTAQLQQAVQD
eukprot:gene12538-12326_t